MSDTAAAIQTPPGRAVEPDTETQGGPEGARIVLRGLTRLFSDGTGLKPVTLDIAPGEFVSLLGPSGCGKSTLLRCLAGLETPQAGSLHFGSSAVFDAEAGIDLSPRERRIGMVFQDLALWPHLSAVENVAFPLRVAGRRRPSREIVAQAQRALDLVGLASFGSKMPHQLSGGQQQRVAVARAIVARPSALLMDEPFSALDAALKVQLREELRSVTAELGITTLFVTHDQAEAMSLSDRIAVLSQGEVRQMDRPESIYESPADEFVAGFVGTFNRLPPTVPGATRGLRPENVGVARAAGRGTGPDDGRSPLGVGHVSVSGTVLGSSYEGGTYRARAAVRGVDEPWHFTSRLPLAPGEHITLTAHEADVITLPAA